MNDKMIDVEVDNDEKMKIEDTVDEGMLKSYRAAGVKTREEMLEEYIAKRRERYGKIDRYRGDVEHNVAMGYAYYL